MKWKLRGDYLNRIAVSSNNEAGKCRGSCLWVIYHHLKQPEVSLTEWVKSFVRGPPPEAVRWHDHNLIPAELREEKVWEMQNIVQWPPMPQLPPGVYTFLIGFSAPPRKAHRVAFFNGADPQFFDPNVGLSKWAEVDWCFYLRESSDHLVTGPGAFTIEVYSYRLNS